MGVCEAARQLKAVWYSLPTVVKQKSAAAVSLRLENSLVL